MTWSSVPCDSKKSRGSPRHRCGHRLRRLDSRSPLSNYIVFSPAFPSTQRQFSALKRTQTHAALLLSANSASITCASRIARNRFFSRPFSRDSSLFSVPSPNAIRTATTFKNSIVPAPATMPHVNAVQLSMLAFRPSDAHNTSPRQPSAAILSPRRRPQALVYRRIEPVILVTATPACMEPLGRTPALR